MDDGLDAARGRLFGCALSALFFWAPLLWWVLS